jgi:uncharacterized protein YdhG (YjbR/CyaY superfamily)
MAAAPKKPCKTFESYAAGFPPDVEMILGRLRETIVKTAPDATIEIKYGMPLFRFGRAYLYVGAWKRHIGLYPVHPQPATLEKAIAPWRSGKDTVQLPYAKPVPYELVARIVKARLADKQ